MAAYGTYLEANEYFQNRLYTLAWDEASSKNKTIALEEATQRIDRLRFSGVKVDETQELEFPRYYLEYDGTDLGPEGDEEIPEDIQIATYELAYCLLDGVDPDLELENLIITQQKYSTIQMNRSLGTLEYIVAGIPSATAWRHLLPYLAPSRPIRIHRVS